MYNTHIETTEDKIMLVRQAHEIRIEIKGNTKTPFYWENVVKKFMFGSWLFFHGVCWRMVWSQNKSSYIM